MPSLRGRQIAIFAGALFLLGWTAFPVEFFADQNVTLKGQVLTKDGQVVPSGVTISLEGENGELLGSRPTDAFGNYSFEGIPAGNYHMTVTADKFQAYQQDVALNFRQVTYTVNVYLTPNNRIQVKVPPALTDEAAPKTARKEFEKGRRDLEQNRFTEARRHLERAVEEYPCYARAQDALAQVDIHDHKTQEAEACFKKAMQCDGSFLDPFSELAEFYILEKRFTESETVLNQGLRLSPQTWIFHYELGQAHYGLKKYPEAVQNYLMAQSLHPDMPAKFHIKLASAYLRTEAYPKALAEFDIYLRLEPNGQYAAPAREVSERMRKDGIAAAVSTPQSAPVKKP